MFRVYFIEYKRFIKHYQAFNISILKEILSNKEIQSCFLYLVVLTITYVIFCLYTTWWSVFILIGEFLYFTHKAQQMNSKDQFNNNLMNLQYCITRDIIFLGNNQLLDEKHMNWLLVKGREKLAMSGEWNHFFIFLKMIIKTFIIPIIFLGIPYWIKFSETDVTDIFLLCIFFFIVCAVIALFIDNIAYFYRIFLSSNTKLNDWLDNIEYMLLDLDVYKRKYQEYTKQKEQNKDEPR